MDEGIFVGFLALINALWRNGDLFKCMDPDDGTLLELGASMKVNMLATCLYLDVNGVVMQEKRSCRLSVLNCLVIELRNFNFLLKIELCRL